MVAQARTRDNGHGTRPIGLVDDRSTPDERDAELQAEIAHHGGNVVRNPATWRVFAVTWPTAICGGCGRHYWDLECGTVHLVFDAAMNNTYRTNEP